MGRPTRFGVAALALGVTVTALAGCSKNTGEHGGTTPRAQISGGIATDPADSRGPAPAVPGARRGGTIDLLQDSDYDHLDPQRTYSIREFAIEQQFARPLTSFRQDSKGNLTLVGDLATTPGTDVHHDCTTWRFTLKHGLKYADGSTITAADVAYGVARSFASFEADGPHYLQQWLANSPDYNAKYHGPYDGGAAVPPGVTVSGQTLTFTFAKPHCDLPFAASMGTTVPVPKARDTKQKYDLAPFSSGPYRIAGYAKGSKLTLVRNKYWDPATDPIRHAYPDRLVVKMGLTDELQANQEIADSGDARYSISQNSVPQQLLSKVTGDVAARSTKGLTSFVQYLAINTQRVKDLQVRKAMEYAINRAGLVQVVGGPLRGSPTTTMLSPATIGYHQYDAYPAGPNGDPAKARKLLAGKHPKLVYGYENNAEGQKQATVVKAAFEKAGFRISLSPIDAATFYSSQQRRNNPWDFYLANWAADWPSGSTVLPPLFDGRGLQPQGNSDTSYLNDAAVNKQIDRISALPFAQAASQWGKLDQQIVTDTAAAVPAYDSNFVGVNGSRVGGVVLSKVLATPVFTDVYVRGS
jgi:peptide/nickel transport system substrate-binding protein